MITIEFFEKKEGELKRSTLKVETEKIESALNVWKFFRIKHGIPEEDLISVRREKPIPKPRLKKYLVEYTEKYSGVYEVWAKSAEEACEQLTLDIAEGRENAPDECVDSDVRVIEQ